MCGSQVRCKLVNYVFQVQKLGLNFATMFASSFQCLNYCKHLFIVDKLKLTIQWKVLGPVGYQEGFYFIELVIIIECEHLFTNEVQTLK
jgi:hypothetical protein